jgi:hypothetical protein
MDVDQQRKAVHFGLWLFGAFVLLLGGTIGVAFLYLHFD